VVPALEEHRCLPCLPQQNGTGSAGFDDADYEPVEEMENETPDAPFNFINSGPSREEEESFGVADNDKVEESAEVDDQKSTEPQVQGAVAANKSNASADAEAEEHNQHKCRKPDMCVVVCMCRKRGQKGGIEPEDPLLKRLERELEEENLRLSLAALEENAARIAAGERGLGEIPLLPSVRGAEAKAAAKAAAKARPRAKPFIRK
jgi:hypothetical protein